MTIDRRRFFVFLVWRIEVQYENMSETSVEWNETHQEVVICTQCVRFDMDLEISPMVSYRWANVCTLVEAHSRLYEHPRTASFRRVLWNGLLICHTLSIWKFWRGEKTKWTRRRARQGTWSLGGGGLVLGTMDFAKLAEWVLYFLQHRSLL